MARNPSTARARRERRSPFGLWFPLFAWMCTLWVLSAQSSLGPAGGFFGLPHGDKIAHATAYAILTVLFFRLFNARCLPLTRRAPVFLALFATLLYGLTDEVHQAYVAGRDASIWDLLADGMGACVAGLFLVLWTDRPRGPSRIGDALSDLKTVPSAAPQAARRAHSVAPPNY